MRLYEGDIAEFDLLITKNQLADVLKNHYESYYRKRATESEYRAWNQSLNFLNNVFRHTNLKENKLIVEFELPYTARRIDALIFGQDLNNKENIVLLELKQ